MLALSEYESGKKKDISGIPSLPQFRKVASIEGEYCLTEKDLYAHHDDSIGAIGVFNHAGEVYEIPFGCLYNENVANLFAAGRIISCDGGAWEAIRVIPVSILTGEVAGIAASLYIDKQLSIDNIQRLGDKRGIKLHFCSCGSRDHERHMVF